MKRNQYYILSQHFSQKGISELPQNLIGQKAIGLYNCPDSLIPPFIVLTNDLFRLWLISPEKIKSILDKILYECMLKFNDKNLKTFIIRSSAENESFDERGFYKSSSGNVMLNDIYSSVIDIWEKNKTHFLENQYTGFSLIIQQYIKPILFGHLSNERRISNSNLRWLYEIENIQDNSRSKEFEVKEECIELPTVECKNRKVLKNTLKNIASYWQTWKQEGLNRYHLEWVWDGNRIWIVQNDIQNNSIKGLVPGSDWDTNLTNISEMGQQKLSCFNTIDNCTYSWKKTNCIKTFQACSLPFGNIYILENEQIINQIALNQIPQDLINDLQWLLLTPIVIRMDVEVSDNILLPRTETLFKIESAIEFLVKNSSLFSTSPNKFCFLIHRFIISKSCALAFSKPNINKTRVDSTWGIVDGLYYHPHDSYEIEPNKAVNKKIRCKTEYIDVNKCGEWYSRKSGTQWDWEQSLTEKQLRTIAQYNLKIRDYLRSPVTVMYFVDTHPKTGYQTILPWFYSTDEIPESSEIQFTDSVFSPVRVLIQNEEDFRKLKEGFETADKKKTLIKLKLDISIVREKLFVETLGAFANNHNIPIELEGSILAHTYYILKKQGARVKCISPFSPKTKKHVFNKLVRDKIPENIEAQGEKVEYRPIPADSKLIYLKRKIIEEAFEFFWERQEDKRLEELADLFEVIRAICNELNISLDKLEEIANNKSNQKGGFEKGFFLFGTEDSSLFRQDLYINEEMLFEGVHIKTEGRNMKKRGEAIQDSFTIPYMPNVTKGSIIPHRLLVNANIISQSIEILYSENGIKIKFLPTNINPNQLTLF
jgi:predicted house-cleaning noncanonical NTP pyrophosphatase (MazG superfamily)